MRRFQLCETPWVADTWFDGGRVDGNTVTLSEQTCAAIDAGGAWGHCVASMVGGLVDGDGDVGPHFRWVSATEELIEILKVLNVPITFSAHCRSGIVGDLCRCWRCRGEKEPTKDESAAARDAQLIDRAKTWRLG